ncbi:MULTISPECIES: malto-oligosyltrehalose trehalohydrolase [Methylobacterium]|uniref:Malto-oligosyltrehalose trehalohydrolase n=1 Tax=Methylobacterium jeotgali TaxID=381630 RepID=A0ABQ4SVA5_9HYPH|nr:MULTISPECIES: malto-oligosyltrehalose trehalohydrolase [Methylobacterium]PIU08276.1 MAG: malto-oligosyltrehalose trehalohydrolase [Methylobacterium sp. CG09_land_8_20_14_0_10_71_15]PIU12870.1 MAG: malto-oligosyltrehalose trehalohydrolase [Methylobacterium sp. CG08_land_8_20_14_0_20_71_15]GBU17540.1 malto-oligosyltrehalose trehalohydrolase [Methylobacterium sp.]GJE07112.1 Malto-oligosyltrehalose trehalohydrolase [Methylobacterium jeotgali]
MTQRTHETAAATGFGTTLTAGGADFALWAPTAKSVTLLVGDDTYDMPDQGGGWRRLTLPEVKAGTRYAYLIDGELEVPDPASRFQPDDAFGRSEVIDPNAYAWKDSGWMGRPFEEAVIYEVHVGTATPEGTYAALQERLPALRDLGVTAIELLPLADFKGTRNWGYDGVLPYAPDSAYGRPDDLRRLVDAAHGLGMMVYLDVVYNHFGPTGNFLHAYAKSFFTERHQTPWGAGINFDGSEGGQEVRRFLIGNALSWLDEFHIDGLRFDAVHAILDDSERHFLGELAETIRARHPDRHIHLMLENEANQASWLERDDQGAARHHDAQWADDLHHCWHVLLTGESAGYYASFADRPVEHLARCLSEGFAYQGEPFPTLDNHPRGEPSGHLPPTAFVTFLQNHDQVGNRALGERLSQLADPAKLALARAGLLLAPQIPMLWMGEEWSASAPFLFFVDFAPDEDLNRAVREGRRREFKSFAAFADDTSVIPDPTEEATFAASKLDWAERERSPHREVLADTTHLLGLRRDTVVPLLKSGYRGASASLPKPDVVDCTWRFADGTLRFVANFGTEEHAVDTGGDSVLWTNAPDPGGTRLPSWTGVFLTGAAR